ncbi:hypothetical protein ABGV42_01495 [Paenibacillus pabuli]|uniref:hypothetical protein n=1 Tax=Paenibacillus pabuli TaxID=1472 RepID=UPI0032423CE9
MNDELFFEAHAENLRRQLRIDPEIFWGNEAIYIVKDINGNLAKGIYIWENDIDLVAVREVKSIGTLAHEMRHAWQYKYRNENNFEFEIPQTGFIKRLLQRIKYKHNYSFDKRELDANKFAANYCKSVGLFNESKRMKNNIVSNNIASGLMISSYVMLLVLGCVIYNFVMTV